MAEFLGLEEEVLRYTICMLILGLSVGMGVGVWNGAAEKSRGLRITSLVIGIGIGTVALLICLRDFFVLLISFLWGKLLLGVLLAGGIAALAFLVGRGTVRRSRMKKYRKNPVMREAVAYCREKGIVGIQCFDVGLVFYSRIHDPDYCVTEETAYYAFNFKDSDNHKNTWALPEHWAAYNKDNCVGAISFADRGYPNLPDAALFAKALARQLGGFRVVSHAHSMQHEAYSTGMDCGKKVDVRTTYVTNLYRDYFVFSKKAEQEARKKARKAAAAPSTQNPHSWE